tara:strand:- start:1381 stop:1554 length:174 start_codon:yes stop_codon:yes gene_type:complete
LPKPRKIRIGDWVRIRKVGISGMYRIIDWDEHGRLVVEQDEDGYKHRMKVNIEEVIK